MAGSTVHWTHWKWLILGGLLSLMVACATQPVPLNQAQAVPPERIFQKELLEPTTERTVAVVIIRDGGLTAAAANITFTIDGAAVAEFETEEILTVFLSPGAYLFGVIFSYDPFEAHPLKEIEAIVREGKKSYFRLLFDGMSQLWIRPTSLYSKQPNEEP